MSVKALELKSAEQTAPPPSKQHVECLLKSLLTPASGLVAKSNKNSTISHISIVQLTNIYIAKGQTEQQVCRSKQTIRPHTKRIVSMRYFVQLNSPGHFSVLCVCVENLNIFVLHTFVIN